LRSGDQDDYGFFMSLSDMNLLKFAATDQQSREKEIIME
jgi:hypothetical protein